METALTIKDSRGGGRISGVEEQTSHDGNDYYAAIRIESGEVTLKSGTIEWFGCSFSLRGNAILNLSGGTIKSIHTERGKPYNNSSVWTHSNFYGTIYLTGTNIENKIGSGIYTGGSSGKVVISGGSYTVTENQVDEKDGYAVTGVDQGTIELSGSPDLGNKGIYLLNGKKMTITGKLNNTNPIHITMKSHGVFTDTAGGNLTYNDASKFISNDTNYIVGKNANGQLLLGVLEPTPSVTFTATGADTGKLSSVTAGMKYSLDGGTNWTDITKR